jgi:chromosomal replication initiation ATPase DnaA
MEFFNPKSFVLQITAPSLVFLFGGSNSGKTHLLGQILSQFQSLFDSNIKVVNFVLIYKFYQEYYNGYIDAIKFLFPKVKVTVLKGLTPENIHLLQKSETWRTKTGEHSILIFDDVASTISKEFDGFWEGRCHHEKISKFS